MRMNDGLETKGYLCQSFSQDGSLSQLSVTLKKLQLKLRQSARSSSIGDGLATVETIDQNTQLVLAVQTLHSASAFFWTGLTGLNHPRGVLGGSDGSIPQLNQWPNGAPPPDTTGLDCVNSSASSGEWAAVSCDTSAVVVCSGAE